MIGWLNSLTRPQIWRLLAMLTTLFWVLVLLYFVW